jgi:hypothetical protein
MIADFPKHVFDLLQQQLATTGRIGATRYFVTPAVTSPAAAGGVSTPSNIKFTERGIALAMYGQESVLATQASFSQCGVRCQIGGTEDLFVDGQGGPAFAHMLALFGGQNCWTPLLRRVQPGVDWTFTFRNDTAAGTINPEVTIAVIADIDLAKMAARAQGQ